MTADYVRWIREKVGHEAIFLPSACAIIVDEEGAVMLLRRGDFKKESWSLPGGLFEIGESAEDAVKREVREETGLEIEILYFLGVYTKETLVSYENGDQCQMVLFVFVCSKKGGTETLNDESKELKYFDVRARPVLFRKHIERALQDYAAGLKGVIR